MQQKLINRYRPKGDVHAPAYTFYCHRIEDALITYDALSYTWGDPEKVEEIQVNGKRLPIARNLYMGLLHLRDPKERRRLWADAVCINQDENSERNHQVKMMQKVYLCASSVIVWLGELEPDSALTLDMILDYNNHLKDMANITWYHPHALVGLSRLFQNPWWRRIWIVQEVVAARELVILLGRTSFPWVYMREVCLGIRRTEFTKVPADLHLDSCAYLKFRDLDSFRTDKAMPIVHLLRSTHDYQATDPRDKLYALLGMASDISTEDVVPDYNKPAHTVFQDLIHFLAVKRGNLDLICLGQWPGPNRQNTPFWLPPQPTAANIEPVDRESLPHQAAANTRARVEMSRFPRLLFAEGAIVDTVGASRHLFRAVYNFESTLQEWRDASTSGENVYYHLLIAILIAEEQKIYQESDESRSLLRMQNKARSRKTESVSDPNNRPTVRKRFLVTKQGRVGAGPLETQTGDKVIVLKGCHVPLIIRAGQDHWVVIGEAYVSGMMFGEIISGIESGRHKPVWMPLKLLS